MEDVQDFVIFQVLVHKWPPSKENLKAQMRADLLKELLAFFYPLTYIWPNSSVRIQYRFQANTGVIAIHDVHANIRPQYKVVVKSD